MNTIAGEGTKEFLQRLLSAARRHLDLEIAFIGEVTDSERIFRYVDADVGVETISVGGADPLSEAYCAHVLTGELPEFLADPAQHPVAAKLAVTSSFPVGTHISVPIPLPNGEVYGTFCCFSTEVRPALGPPDVRSLRMMAELAGDRLHLLHEREKADGERRKLIESLLAGTSRIDVVFQPLWDLTTMTIVGLEALSRFPDVGAGPQSVFEQAAKAGLAVDLESHVAGLALAEFNRIPSPVRLNINVSPDTLSSERFLNLLEGYPADRLVVEVTEHAVVEDFTAMRETSATLAERGIWLAIDDVGMGFSGLNRILESDPEELKLDAAVIRDIDRNPVKQALVEALCSFGDRAGFEIVAEGIETADELAALKGLGAKLGQGFLLGRPGPIDRVIAQLTSDEGPA